MARGSSSAWLRSRKPWPLSRTTRFEYYGEGGERERRRSEKKKKKKNTKENKRKVIFDTKMKKRKEKKNFFLPLIHAFFSLCTTTLNAPTTSA